MTALFDLMPVVAFFVAYKIAGMKAAVAALMVGALVQVAYYRLASKKIGKHIAFSIAAILVFGSLTLALDDPLLIMLKPTFVFACMAVALAAALLLGKNPVAAIAAEAATTVPAQTWRNIGWQWVGCFLFLGAVNLALVWTVSEEAWVNFKVFGITAMTMLLAIAQGMMVYRQQARNERKEGRSEPVA